MKFAVSKASDWSTAPRKEVEINTLEDLKALTEDVPDCRERLVIDFKDHEITIYDDWIE